MDMTPRTKWAISTANMRNGQYTPAPSRDDYQPGLSRRTTQESDQELEATMTDGLLMEDPDEDDFGARTSNIATPAQAREPRFQASLPPQMTAQYLNLILQDKIANNPQFAIQLLQMAQQQHTQQSTQQATIQSATAPLPPPPPISIPPAGDAAAAQTPTTHKPTGHIYGKVTIRGEDTNVLQGNIIDEKTDPMLVKNHVYGEVEVDRGAKRSKLKQSDMCPEGFCVYLNSLRCPSI